MYELTPEGREACLETIAKMECRTRMRSEFMFVLASVPSIPYARLERLFEQRLTEIEEQLRDIDAIKQEPMNETIAGRRNFVLEMARTILNAERDFLETHSADVLEPSNAYA